VAVLAVAVVVAVLPAVAVLVVLAEGASVLSLT
jgi:hypothetical protein